MTHVVTKELTFDAAHRLYKYEGKCANIHGHQYKILLTLSTTDLDSRKISVDFGLIKRYFQNWLDEKWDHKVILHIEDPLNDYLESLVKTTRLFGIELPYAMPCNPTAEGMAEYLATIIFPQIISENKIPAKIKNVRVFETPTSYCDYTVE
jgi:6-pyruvoyltetrahydropterin/6-carboxytetrahydropterin synthase